MEIKNPCCKCIVSILNPHFFHIVDFVVTSYFYPQFFRENEVYKHLEEYIRRASGLTQLKEHLIEVSVLCVQCMEVSKIFSLCIENVLGHQIS